MTSHRAVNFFPRSWRERYGDEFAALLDDLKAEGHLGLATMSDVIWAALKHQIGIHRGRRAMVAISATFAILGAALGLGVSLTASAAGSTFVVPPIQSTTTPALANSVGNSACALTSPLASGQLLTASNLPAVSAAPGYRSIVASSGTTQGLKWRLLERDDAATRSEPLTVRVLAGGLAVNGRWYSLCDSLRQGTIGPVSSGGTYGLVATGVHGQNGPAAFVYGLAPAGAQNLLLHRGDGATTSPTFIAEIGSFRLFLTPWRVNPCQAVQQNTVSYVSEQEAWSEVTLFGPACQSGEPALANGDGGGGTPRTAGTVSEVEANFLVLSTPYWLPLKVEKTSTTEVFVDTDDVVRGRGPFQAVPWNRLRDGDQVFVSGTIGQNSATATDVYIHPR